MATRRSKPPCPEATASITVRHAAAGDGSDEAITLGRVHVTDVNSDLQEIVLLRLSCNFSYVQFATRKRQHEHHVEVQKSITNAAELKRQRNQVMKSSAAATNKSATVAQRL
jgi:restriction endonuclease Mrr